MAVALDLRDDENGWEFIFSSNTRLDVFTIDCAIEFIHEINLMLDIVYLDPALL